MHIRSMWMGAMWALAAVSACATDWSPHSAFIAEGGVTAHGTYSLTAGVAWPWAWHRISRYGQWSAATELMVSRWSAKRPGGGREGLTQIAAVPMFRYHFDHGDSPWFAEGGIGVSSTDRLYQTDRKRFSTRFNFHDNVGVGRSFGAQRENELSLRFLHVSNAGIREPNPGENFVQLRYARNF